MVLLFLDIILSPGSSTRKKIPDRYQIQIKGQRDAGKRRADGSQRNRPGNGPGDQGRNDNRRIFQADRPLLRAHFNLAAKLVRQHNSQSLVAAHRGGKHRRRKDRPERRDFFAQLLKAILHSI